MTNFAANSFLYLLLLPYLSPIPFDSDIQPLFVLISIFLLVLKIYQKGKIKFNRTDFIFLIISLFSILFISLEDTPILKKQLGLLVAFLIYYTYKEYYKYFHIDTVYFALMTLVFGAIFQYIFPEIFGSFFENFINHIRYSPEQGRGLTSLTPEPAFFAASLMVISFILSTEKMKKIEPIGRYYFFQFIIIFFLLMTKSFVSIIFLVFILFHLFNIKKSLFIIITIFALTGLQEGNHRAAVIFNKIEAGNVFSDKSISHRVSNLYSAWYAITTSPLGYGSGSFKRIAFVAADSKPDFYLLEDDSAGVVVSSFSRLVVEMGLFFIVFLLYIYIFKHKGRVVPKLASFFMLLVTFPVVYPGIWILLYLSGDYEKK